MAFNEQGLNSYVDVAQRIADFRERYPDGSLQPADQANPFDIRQVEGVDKAGKEFKATFIVYRAAAYRTPDDQRPGIGMAWEVFPGRTPYTLGSELMNAETSAWGRAIVAALASDSKRGVSSREEVRNRSAEQDESWRDQAPVNRNPRQQARTPDSSEWETAPAGNSANGHAPAQAPADDGPDGEAQEIAQLAHEARQVSDVSALTAKAHDAGKLSKVIVNPATGKSGPLGRYLGWRRQQVTAEVAAFAALTEAGKAAGLEDEALGAVVEELTGANIEAATVAQMKEATAKLAARAGAPA
jgi:hypothetical protein